VMLCRAKFGRPVGPATDSAGTLSDQVRGATAPSSLIGSAC
jgi:hypothetical protein